MKRIFIGIPIREEIKFEILKFQEIISADFKNQDQVNKVRWTKPGNLHITLMPPWYEEDIQAVSSKLKSNKRPKHCDRI